METLQEPLAILKMTSIIIKNKNPKISSQPKAMENRLISPFHNQTKITLQGPTQI